MSILSQEPLASISEVHGVSSNRDNDISNKLFKIQYKTKQESTMISLKEDVNESKTENISIHQMLVNFSP